MDSFHNIFDDWSTEEDAEELDPYRGREGTIFLIDFRRSMFEGQNFKLSLESVKHAMLKNIMFNNNRYVGIVLFGTAEKDKATHRKNVAVLQPLDKANAKRVIDLDEMLSSNNRDDVQRLGQSDEACLAEAFETCFYLFTNFPTKLGYKRILLFTDDENPDGDLQDKTRQHQARKRAEELKQGRIDLDVIPLGIQFDTTRFYQDIVETVKKQNFTIDGPYTCVEDIVDAIHRESYSKRSLGRVKLHLGAGVCMGVSLYKFTSPPHIIKKTTLHRETNEPVRSVIQQLHPETGRKVQSFDIVKAFDLDKKSITFNVEEFDKLKKAFDPGMTLLGFKPDDRMKPEYHCKPASFIFPDESLVKGSTTLFAALLNRCLARNVVAVCVITARRSGKPTYVLLKAQKEISTGESYKRLPSGFHVFFLPFADSLFTFPPGDDHEVSTEQLDLTKKIIKKLRIKYIPTMIRNPKTDLEWAYIEAMALNYPEPSMIVDCTLPDYGKIDEKLGGLLHEFNEQFGDTESMKNPPKRPAASRQADQSANKKQKTSKQIENLISQKKVTALTIPELKDTLSYVKSTKLSLSGLKKADLVCLVYENKDEICANCQ